MRIGGQRGVAFAVAFVVALGALASGAFGAGKGSLTFVDCMIVGTDPECAKSSPQALNPDGIAISKDGKDVYLANDDYDTVSHLRVKSDGALRYEGCVGDEMVLTGCDEQAPNLDSVENVAVSPNGKRVYAVADSLFASVIAFKRRGDGSLKFESCVGETPCAQDPGFLDPQGVAVSPNNRDVYVTDTSQGSLSRLTHNKSGDLRYQGCISDSINPVCPKTMVGLSGAEDLAVAPDGKSVYVATEEAEMAVLKRGKGGKLTAVGCWGDADGPNQSICGPTTDGLDGTDQVAVSGDGDNVYIVGNDGMVIFDRKGDGTLKNPRCLEPVGASTDCIEVASFGAMRGVAISPDDRFVYTAATSGQVHAFSRRPNGDLKDRGCVQHTTVSLGCAASGSGIADAETLVVGKGSKFVYVAGEDQDTVAWLEIDR